MKSVIIALLVLLTFSAQQFSIDFSVPYSNDVFKSFVSRGYARAIIRGLTSYGKVDSFAQSNLASAKSAGAKTDIYMFPCRSKSANSQVDEMMKQILPSLYKRVWVKVVANPSEECSWHGSHIVNNCQYIKNIVSRIKSYGKEVGIYTSGEQWQSIVGSRAGCPEIAKETKLWYIHYDSTYSFSDYIPFGGWQQPIMKQYCGEHVAYGYLVGGISYSPEQI